MAKHQSSPSWRHKLEMRALYKDATLPENIIGSIRWPNEVKARLKISAEKIPEFREICTAIALTDIYSAAHYTPGKNTIPEQAHDAYEAAIETVKEFLVNETRMHSADIPIAAEDIVKTIAEAMHQAQKSGIYLHRGFSRN